MAQLVDVALAAVVIVVAAAAIFLFVRANRSPKPAADPPKQDTDQEKKDEALRLELQLQESRVKIPAPDRKIATGDVEKAKARIRTLTLQQEIDSLVLRRLFEAEDEGEVSKDERVKMAKPYEDEMRAVSDELKRSEMLVSLSELESIREEMIKKFEDSISQTQIRIDTILKELKIEQEQKATAVVEEDKPKQPASPKKKRIIKQLKPAADQAEEEEESEEADEPDAAQPEAGQAPHEKPQPMDVETRLSQLKKEVMKELDELDKLDLEAQ